MSNFCSKGYDFPRLQPPLGGGGGGPSFQLFVKYQKHKSNKSTSSTPRTRGNVSSPFL